MASTYTSFDIGPAMADLDGLLSAVSGEDMLGCITENTEIMWRDAQSRVDFGSGAYRDAIRWKVFANPDGPVGTVFVIQGPWAGHPGTLWPKNLPLWLEYGTRRAGPHPHLIPAFNAAVERTNRDVERLITQAAS